MFANSFFYTMLQKVLMIILDINIKDFCMKDTDLYIYMYIYVMVFTYILLILLLDFRSCIGLVSRDKIPQVITRFYLSPHSPPTFKVVLTRFGSLISPYVPLGHQSGTALWLQLCNIWAS